MARAIGSAGERLVHTEEVTGSIPVSPTQPKGRFQSQEPAFLVLVQQQSAATGHQVSQSLSLRSASRVASEGASV
jgi:hypothetical protein